MSFYSKFRTNLSHKNKGHLSSFLINSGLKPSCNKGVKSQFSKGIIVFSADFEMAWAYRFSKTKKDQAIQFGLHERNQVPYILELFNSFNIPVTWATVGHLFLKKCVKGKNGLPHSDMPRPHFFENRNWRFSNGDWYKNDPCTKVESDPAWYASDLIEHIISSDTPHEIGCHTFSHIDFTYRNCSKELADAELNACIELANKRNVKLQSMVFPGGTAGNYESLVQKGFISYRKPMNYHLDLPQIDDFGLVAIPSSLGLDRDSYGWSKEFHLKMIRNFISKAARHRLVCHFWFHPSMDPWYLNNVMPEVIKIVADMRNSQQIDVLTMGELSQQILVKK